MLQLLAAAEFDKFAALMRFRARNASKYITGRAAARVAAAWASIRAIRAMPRTPRLGRRASAGRRARRQNKDADGDAGADGHELSCAALYVDDNEDSDSG